MTTNMNFGPEWMRSAATIRSNTLDSQNLRSLQSISEVRSDCVNSSLSSISPSVPNLSSSPQHNHSNGLANEKVKDSDGCGSSLTGTPYKYSSTFMLSLYKPVSMPAEFKQHDNVAVEESQIPLSFVPLTEEEKKVRERVFRS
ncbi:hypothetical protein BX666DRAFT_1900181 [Dichotomocladium elegans]|nr:hypothetical protein BX666DRAFT_1900181 [Dichotomocladium elegans]